MAWPKKVPILEASDICRFKDDGPKNTHCLQGWIRTVFDERQSLQVRKLLATECGRSIVVFNDNRKNSLASIAAVWNRVMRNLGYTVPCDR